MAVTVLPGYQFSAEEQVTPTKLNRMVDLATVYNIPATEFTGGGFQPLAYGSVTPTLARGVIHYDTTPGYEGLKYAFVSASNASVARWLYRTPHFDGIFWAVSGATMALPQVLAAFIKPACFNIYDGNWFPYIHPLLGAASHASLSDNCQVLIPLESRADPGPVACAMLGLVPGAFAATPVSGGLIYINSFDPVGLATALNTLPVNRSIVVGLGAYPAALPSATNPSWLFAGTLLQDAKP